MQAQNKLFSDIEATLNSDKPSASPEAGGFFQFLKDNKGGQTNLAQKSSSGGNDDEAELEAQSQDVTEVQDDKPVEQNEIQDVDDSEGDLSSEELAEIQKQANKEVELDVIDEDHGEVKEKTEAKNNETLVQNKMLHVSDMMKEANQTKNATEAPEISKNVVSNITNSTQPARKQQQPKQEANMTKQVTNPYDSQFDQNLKQAEMDPEQYQKQYLAKKSLTQQNSTVASPTHESKTDSPPVDQLTLHKQNNIDLSGYAQSMPGMIMQAKMNQGLSEKEPAQLVVPQQQMQPVMVQQPIAPQVQVMQQLPVQPIQQQVVQQPIQQPVLPQQLTQPTQLPQFQPVQPAAPAPPQQVMAQPVSSSPTLAAPPAVQLPQSPALPVQLSQPPISSPLQPLLPSDSSQMMSALMSKLNQIGVPNVSEQRPSNPYMLQTPNLTQNQQKDFKGYKYYTQMQNIKADQKPFSQQLETNLKDLKKTNNIESQMIDSDVTFLEQGSEEQDIGAGNAPYSVPAMAQKSAPAPAAEAKKASADQFDQGWHDSSKTGLSVGAPATNIEHTFFGHEEAGLSMLVQEQKQLEKMQAYSFQQFKQIQKMMMQMQKSQQWSFNNIQGQIDSIQQKVDLNHNEEKNFTQDLSHTLAMSNYYTNLKSDMIKNINSTAVDLKCSNVFYCQNGANCTQVSMCQSNDTCSTLEKCDQKTGNCSKQEVCSVGSKQLVQQQQEQNHTANTTASEPPAPGPPQPVVHKTKEEISEAQSRLSQLREHLDVTALFLGQDNIGKIIAKLEMDAADPPLPQTELPALFAKCNKEVESYMAAAEAKQTDAEKQQDIEDQNAANYA